MEPVCLKTYSLDTVKQVCYRFAASGFQSLSVDDATNKTQVHFRFPSTVSGEEEETLMERFHQDILDQDLRQSVAQRTEVVRHLILANAFADTALVEHGDD